MVDLRLRLVQLVLSKSDALRLKKQPFDYPQINCVSNLPYRSGVPNTEYRLDLYIPLRQAGPFPLIIDIHGGGLVYGSKELNRWTCAEMAERGYAVAALNYPLMPRASLIEQLQSLLDALSFIEQMGHPRIDLGRVCLKGDSGGGLLSILLSELIELNKTKEGLFRIRHSYGIKAMCLIHPMIHTKRRDILAFINSYKGAKENVQPEEWSILSNPTKKIRSDLPIWLVTCKNDIMFHQEARELAAHLNKIGQASELYDHPFRILDPLQHIFMVTEPKRAESQYLYDQMDCFLSKVFSSHP